MLFVKFYTSVILLYRIHWQKDVIMVMLLLHISALCDTIDMHLFESYPKTDKIHVESDPQLRFPTTNRKQPPQSRQRKIKRPYLRDGSFLFMLIALELSRLRWIIVWVTRFKVFN